MYLCPYSKKIYAEIVLEIDKIVPMIIFFRIRACSVAIMRILITMLLYEDNEVAAN